MFNHLEYGKIGCACVQNGSVYIKNECCALVTWRGEEKRWFGYVGGVYERRSGVFSSPAQQARPSWEAAEQQLDGADAEGQEEDTKWSSVQGNGGDLQSSVGIEDSIITWLWMRRLQGGAGGSCLGPGRRYRQGRRRAEPRE